MNSDAPDSLDQLLGDWAASRAADEELTHRLSRRILTAARDETASLPEPPRPAAVCGKTVPAAEWVEKWMVGGGGILLLLLLVGSVLYYHTTTAPRGSRQPAPAIATKAESTTDSSSGNEAIATVASAPPPASALGAAVLTAKQQLLTEMNACFDNQLVWIADGPRHVLLDVGQEVVAANDDFLLVRVVVARRASPDLPWSTVWQTDVISRNETLVEVTSELLDGSTLALWTHRMSDGAVAVDMELLLDQLTLLQSSSSTVLQPGQPTQVGCSSEDGFAHCVFQTVMPLHLAGI